MKIAGFLIGLFAASTISVFAGAQDYRYVDLTYEFGEDTVYWPTAEKFAKSTVAEGITEQGYYYSAYEFATAEHGGTHMDAPIHFHAAGQSADEIGLERLIGNTVRVDVTESVGDDADYLITIEDVQGWEATYGPIPTGAIVLFRTGWGRFWPQAADYLGTATRGLEAVPDLHFPGLHPEAARFLVDERNIAAVGIDTASIDYGQSKTFEAHQVLAAAGVPIFENVANLADLPDIGFAVTALPMKIKGGSGAPLRIVAIIPRGESTGE